MDFEIILDQKRSPPWAQKPEQDETESRLIKPDTHDDQAIEN